MAQNIGRFLAIARAPHDPANPRTVARADNRIADLIGSGATQRFKANCTLATTDPGPNGFFSQETGSALDEAATVFGSE